MIFTNELDISITWLYENETIDQVVADLADRLNIEYQDYIEITK